MQLAFQNGLFCTMWPGREKSLLASLLGFHPTSTKLLIKSKFGNKKTKQKSTPCEDDYISVSYLIQNLSKSTKFIKIIAFLFLMYAHITLLLCFR